jgi:hypothetical protein
MKKAWHVVGTLFEAGYLVVTLSPSRGTPQNEKKWRELQRLMRGLSRVERGWDWRVDRKSPSVDLVFPQTTGCPIWSSSWPDPFRARKFSQRAGTENPEFD